MHWTWQAHDYVLRRERLVERQRSVWSHQRSKQTHRIPHTTPDQGIQSSPTGCINGAHPGDADVGETLEFTSTIRVAGLKIDGVRPVRMQQHVPLRRADSVPPTAPASCSIISASIPSYFRDSEYIWAGIRKTETPPRISAAAAGHFSIAKAFPGFTARAPRNMRRSRTALTVMMKIMGSAEGLRASRTRLVRRTEASHP